MAYFNKGSIYHVWERKGVAPDKAGRRAISENSFEGGEVLPEMRLEYLGKKEAGFEGQHAAKILDGPQAGTVLKVHRNHTDPNTAYNQAKLASRAKNGGGTPQTPQTAEARIALLQERQAADAQLMATLQAEVEAAAQAEADVPAEAPEGSEENAEGENEDEELDVEAILMAASEGLDEESEDDDSDEENDEAAEG